MRGIQDSSNIQRQSDFSRGTKIRINIRRQSVTSRGTILRQNRRWQSVFNQLSTLREDTQRLWDIRVDMLDSGMLPFRLDIKPDSLNRRPVQSVWGTKQEPII